MMMKRSWTRGNGETRGWTNDSIDSRINMSSWIANRAIIGDRRGQSVRIGVKVSESERRSVRLRVGVCVIVVGTRGHGDGRRDVRFAMRRCTAACREREHERIRVESWVQRSGSWERR